MIGSPRGDGAPRVSSGEGGRCFASHAQWSYVHGPADSTAGNEHGQAPPFDALAANLWASREQPTSLCVQRRRQGGKSCRRPIVSCYRRGMHPLGRPNVGSSAQALAVGLGGNMGTTRRSRGQEFSRRSHIQIAVVVSGGAAPLPNRTGTRAHTFARNHLISAQVEPWKRRAPLMDSPVPLGESGARND